LVVLFALLCTAVAAPAAPPTPEAHFGHRMGADRTLVEWRDVVSYFHALADESDRVEVSELGKTTEGRPLLLATIADPATLRDLERYRQIQEQLADPRRTTPEQAETLAAEGKAVVLITCSIHSTEVASTHTAIEFVHKLVSEDSPRHRAILAGTIFLLVPSLNPDGVDKVAAWYKRFAGTPYEGAPMIELYQKYVGHDNNRDWYMFTQAETRLVVDKVHNAWHPQIVYDVHQMGSSGARMFVPPWIDPIDPNIDPLIMQQVNQMGAAMAVDLTAAGKTGVVINGIYDHFTPARHYQSYHGGMRLLSESASVRYATPVTTPFSALETEARGYNAQRASWNFLEPWPGGRWTLRDIVDYQLITFESCLYHAAIRREDLLRNFYRIGERVMRREAPWAYWIPTEQHDPNAMTRLLETLEFGLVEIERVQETLETPGRSFQEGDYLVRLAQPFGSFAKTLLERQDYPDLRVYPGGPPRRPYDVTAHSLPLLLGVEAIAVEEAASLKLAPAGKIGPVAGTVAQSSVLALSPAWSNSWKAVNRLLKARVPVHRDQRYGTFYVANQGTARPLLGQLAADLGLAFTASEADLAAHRRLRTSRVGLYQGFVPIMDEGWTRWVLEQYEFPYHSVGNQRVRQGGLNGEFDVIILPDATPQTLHAGYIPGALYGGSQAPLAYTGGLGAEGAEALRGFLENGGTVLAFNEASSYALERLRPGGVRDVLENSSHDQFYGPGSLLNARLDISHPLCFGMSPRQAVWFESGPVFEASRQGNPAARSVLSYPQNDILASGWLLGEQLLAGRSAVMDVAVGRGHLVLFGIRPQYRGQPNATFKLVFNGLYYWER
jgi:hypothetical protein